MKSQKKEQVWFETDLGYAATKDKLLQSRDVIADGQDYGGRFTFRLRNLKDFTVQITTRSKVGITYPEMSDYDVVLERLKPYLAKADSSPAKTISMLESSRVRERPSTERPSVLNIFSYLKWRKEYEDAKREKRLRELECDLAAHREIMFLDEDDPDLFGKMEDIKAAYRKKYGLQ